jgi:hypothetical protein
MSGRTTVSKSGEPDWPFLDRTRKCGWNGCQFGSDIQAGCVFPRLRGLHGHRPPPAEITNGSWPCPLGALRYSDDGYG